MADRRIDDIGRAMDEQLSRKVYPEGFPPLPDVPTGRYIEVDFAAAERQHMWGKNWQFAGVADALPEPGCYFLFERIGQSVIVCRDRDGIVRAFHNVCRHRGSALVANERGKTNRFSFPYHSWTYGLNGGLVAVPEAQDFACLNKAERGLIPVRCEVWRGGFCEL